MPSDDGRLNGPPREKILNAPLLPVLIALSMPVLFYFQTRLPDGGLDLAFVPRDLQQGRWSGLFTSMLLHGGWLHAVMNAIGALTFGAPVARLMRGPGGVLSFLLLYVGAGVFAALGYGLVHIESVSPLVGASGAVFGLIGAATRLIGGRGTILPLNHPGVIRMAIVWMAVNAATGLIGFAPGAGGATIAWEAHAFGFLFGILAIGPMGGLFVRRDQAFALPDSLDDPRG